MNYDHLSEFCDRVYVTDLDEDGQPCDATVNYIRCRVGMTTRTMSVARRWKPRDFTGAPPLFDSIRSFIHASAPTYKMFVVEGMTTGQSSPSDSCPPITSDMWGETEDEEELQLATMRKRGDSHGLQAMALVATSKVLNNMIVDQATHNRSLVNEIIDLTRLVTQQSAEIQLLNFMISTGDSAERVEFMKQASELFKPMMPALGALFVDIIRRKTGVKAEAKSNGVDQGEEHDEEASPDHEDPGAVLDAMIDDAERILEKHPELMTAERTARLMGWARFAGASSSAEASP